MAYHLIPEKYLSGYSKLAFLLFFTLLILSCGESKDYELEVIGDLNYSSAPVDISKEAPLFSLLPSQETGITFINNITESDNFNYYSYSYIYNGGGIAVGDINNDGLPDIYFTGNMVPNRLYLNMGDFKFKDITAQSNTDGGIGFKTGVTMVDINNDGYLDIYICKSSPMQPEYRRNLLYINNGDLTFTESAAEYGLDDPSFSTQAYFFDIDGDGDLDLYLLNHLLKSQESNVLNARINEEGNYEVALSEDLTYTSDKLFINENGKFRDISKEAGIINEAFGLSAVVADFNGDALLDIYVCNDYVKSDYLYINNGDNTFTERFSDFMTQTAFSSMGSDYGDFNNDGCPDLMVLDMLPPDDYRRKMLGSDQSYAKYLQMLRVGIKPQFTRNVLQLNNCNGFYSEISLMAGVAATDWSWTTLFADLDNSGWKDIFVSNGYRREVSNIDYTIYQADSLKKLYLDKHLTITEWMDHVPEQKTYNHLFMNNQNLTFSDVSKVWEVGPESYSGGAVYADLNNDGYLDLVVSNIGDEAFVFENTGHKSRGNNYVRFDLIDPEGHTTYGAQIRLYSSDGFQHIDYYPTRGFLSSVEPIIHFGIAKANDVEKVEIIWPDGTVQVETDININFKNTIVKTKIGNKFKYPDLQNLYFKPEDISSDKSFAHEENVYIDFKREPLLYRMLSKEGPAMAVADIDGDGLDDVFIGASVGYAGKVFLQQEDGSFKFLRQPEIAVDSLHEDVDAVFFDADGDGHPDLYIVSGGNEYPANSKYYIDRLYINDGKGTFSKSTDALPKLTTSGSCVRVADIDGDGQLDIFLGGRSTPGAYPLTPYSYLLKNNKGSFSNVTSDWSSGLLNIGMVTDAVFADLDLDGQDELIVVGEWLPVTVFKRQDGVFLDVTSSMQLDKLVGWWYSVAVEDLDGDGYPEIIAGNLGLNNLLNVGPETPTRLYASDFDGNGTMDAVLTYYNQGVSYPVMFRDKMLDQMVGLKKKFLKYDTYARATINDIFSKAQLRAADVYEANTMAHYIFKNNKGASFEPMAMPLYTQIGPVRSIVIDDINGNGYKDIVVGGADYGTDIEIGPFAASVGAVLINEGNLNFNVLRPGESGFFIPGNVRSIKPISTNEGESYLVSRNDDTFLYFKRQLPPEQ